MRLDPMGGLARHRLVCREGHHLANWVSNLIPILNLNRKKAEKLCVQL